MRKLGDNLHNQRGSFARFAQQPTTHIVRGLVLNVCDETAIMRPIVKDGTDRSEIIWQKINSF